MEIMDLLSLSILGTLLSLLIEWLKGKFGASSTGTKLLVVGLSIAVGTGYFLLRDTQLFLAITGILVVSQTVYSLLLKDFFKQ